MSGRASRRHRKARERQHFDVPIYFTIVCPHCNEAARVSGHNAHRLIETIDADDTAIFDCPCGGQIACDRDGVHAA